MTTTEFGIQEMKTYPDSSLVNELCIGQRDFSLFLKSRNKTIVLGFNPLSKIHLGHLAALKLGAELQRKENCNILLVLPVFEAFFSEKHSLKEVEDKARQLVPQLLAIGFLADRTKILIDSKTPTIFKHALNISGKITYNTYSSVYGQKDRSLGELFSPMLQIAQLLSPMIMNKKTRILIIAGMNEDPHIRLCRDSAQRLGLKKPSALYVRFLNGLDGKQMSKKRPMGVVYIGEDPEEIKKKTNSSSVDDSTLSQYCLLFGSQNKKQLTDAILKLRQNMQKLKISKIKAKELMIAENEL